MNTAGPASHPNRTRWLSGAAVSIAAVVMVVLGLEVRTLRPQGRELKNRRAFPYIGQWVPTARVPRLNADSVTIGETTIVHVRPAVLVSQSGIDSVLAAVRHADSVDTGVQPVSGAGSPQGVRRGTNIVPDQE